MEHWSRKEQDEKSRKRNTNGRKDRKIIKSEKTKTLNIIKGIKGRWRKENLTYRSSEIKYKE